MEQGAVQSREAGDADVPLLARMNAQLIRDEGHRNRMTLAELEERMRGFLAGQYEAVLFECGGEVIGYALFRTEEAHTYLRQFFISPERRHRGYGRQAIAWLRTNRWRDRRVRLDVLVGNTRAISFWRSIGFVDYCLTMEAEPT